MLVHRSLCYFYYNLILRQRCTIWSVLKMLPQEIFSCIKKNFTRINLFFFFFFFSMQFLDPLVVDEYLPKFEMSFR